MRQRTALPVIALAIVAAACSEAPTGPLRPEGASRNAAVQDGGMFGSGHKNDTTTTTTTTSTTGTTPVTDSTSTGDEAVGGMFGSGH
ncbi:MAG TPA: hypothetical protein VGB92_19265 [Longimicrobium sp.]|jgi:hypothetical protein